MQPNTHFSRMSASRVCGLRHLQTQYYTAEEYSAFKNV